MPAANPSPSFRYAWIAAAGSAVVAVALLWGLFSGERLTAVMLSVVAGFVVAITAVIAAIREYWRAMHAIPQWQWNTEPYRSISRRSGVRSFMSTLLLAGGTACNVATGMFRVDSSVLKVSAVILMCAGITMQVVALISTVAELHQLESSAAE